jgi:hypothetical protein
MSLLDLFCHVDEFCRQFVPTWIHRQLSSGTRQRQRANQLSVSEIMTLLIWFHCSHYRTFKAYYTEEVQRHLRAEFPGLVSYSRFVELTPTVLLPLLAYLRTCLGACSGDNGEAITAAIGLEPIGLEGGSGIDRYNSPRTTPNPIALITIQRRRSDRRAGVVLAIVSCSASSPTCHSIWGPILTQRYMEQQNLAEEIVPDGYD